MQTRVAVYCILLLAWRVNLGVELFCQLICIWEFAAVLSLLAFCCRYNLGWLMQFVCDLRFGAFAAALRFAFWLVVCTFGSSRNLVARVSSTCIYRRLVMLFTCFHCVLHLVLAHSPCFTLRFNVTHSLPLEVMASCVSFCVHCS